MNDLKLWTWLLICLFWVFSVGAAAKAAWSDSCNCEEWKSIWQKPGTCSKEGSSKKEGSSWKTWFNWEGGESDWTAPNPSFGFTKGSQQRNGVGFQSSKSKHGLIIFLAAKCRMIFFHWRHFGAARWHFGHLVRVGSILLLKSLKFSYLVGWV